ncbi:MAG: hypothetical protein U1F65_05090 [Verrucomicrobiota bacterium]
MTKHKTKHLKFIPWLWLAGILFLARPGSLFAQDLYLGARVNTANGILVNSSVTYTIGVTNFTPFVPSSVFVTNTLPAAAQITGLSQTQGTVTTNGSSVIFNFNAIGIGFTAVATLTVKATAVGAFTNQITMVSDLPALARTNVVLQVTNTVILGDLAVSMTGPPATVFPGDWTTYSLLLTNRGPNTVTNITLTNGFPVGLKVLGVSPASQAFTLATNQISFPFTLLTNRGSQQLVLKVQLPTNSGAALFTTSVGAPGSQDTNTANNVTSTNVLISPFFDAALAVATNSPQITNRQNGLIEQKILLTNHGTTNLDAVRIVIAGLTNVPVAGFTNSLFNAWGTNNGQPYVVYASTLAAGDSVELLLQFSVRNRSKFPFASSQLNAFAVAKPDLTPPAAVTSSTSVNFTNIALASPGNLLLQFKSTAGRVYTIVYADNLSFSNAVIAVPSLAAPANYVQWIDYGPPGTLSPPGGGARYYRVFEHP